MVTGKSIRYSRIWLGWRAY